MTSSWQASAPYNQLPPLPPEADLESKAILKACITARAAVAELKQAAELIPNPAVLIHTLPLLEAQASSEIENIVTTTDKLFRHLHHEDQADPSTKEALRYSRALFEGYRALARAPLNTRTAEEICTQIKGVQMSVRRGSGTALANDATGQIIYTPPEGEALLRDMLANWERFTVLEVLEDAVVVGNANRPAGPHTAKVALADFLDWLQPAYCVTVEKSQGDTIREPITVYDLRASTPPSPASPAWPTSTSARCCPGPTTPGRPSAATSRSRSAPSWPTTWPRAAPRPA